MQYLKTCISNSNAQQPLSLSCDILLKSPEPLLQQLTANDRNETRI